MSGTNCKVKLSPKEKGNLLLIFGDDQVKHLDFELAAQSLARDLKKRYTCESLLVPIKVNNSGAMMKLLLEKREEEKKIKEIHIFSHSWSAGIGLNFGEEHPEQFLPALKEIYGDDVENLMYHDDSNDFNPTQVRLSNFYYLTKDQQQTLMSNFASGAKIQLWGCMTGTEGSTKIAQTIADFTGATTIGSSSSTEFRVIIGSDKKKWDEDNRPKYRSDVVNGKYRLTMVPARGKYLEFKPNPIDPVLFKDVKKVPTMKLLDKNKNKIILKDQSDYYFKWGDTFFIQLIHMGEPGKNTKKTIIFNENQFSELYINEYINAPKDKIWQFNGGNIETTADLVAIEVKAYNEDFSTISFYITVKWEDKEYISRGRFRVIFKK